MHEPASAAIALVSLLPMLLVFLVVAIAIFVMAPRKGRSRAWAILGLLPLVNVLVLIWLASLTDKAVLDALAELRRRSS
ncbi:hypothetical protein [Oleiharenicola sp. Vm1]|uniref:hypothetical protein n=1 Tax=Oleiharenicola sp. Vm1 TaxID=3398393 RepID=UPI0039F5150F